MKRLSCITVLVVFCFSIFALSVNPSMDGRAIVADNGIFPPGGYYGRAPGYLPGDTVVVTNHSNGFSIDVLILGSYDAYEGIAILLSPEAAEKLQIVKGKDVYVKVQKKQPIPYEEAVATSRNKRIKEKQAIDTDKDSSVLPGETEDLVNEVISSNKNEISQDETLPLEDLEPVVSDVVVPEEATESTESESEIMPEENTELADVESEILPEENIEISEVTEPERFQPDVIEEELLPEVAKSEEISLPETEVTESENSETELLPESSEIEPTESEFTKEDNKEEIVLADPEELVESEEIEAPVFEEEQEVPEIVEVVEVPETTEDEVVLDEIENENFDNTDFIDTPVEEEIAEVPVEEILPVEEVNKEDSSEELAELEEITEEYQEDEDYIVLEDTFEPSEEILSETEVAEVESSELSSEGEIFIPEILPTETIDEEPELALADDFELNEPEKSVVESPKDIFSMIVGETPEDDVIQDVVLEETEPKLPELDDVNTEESFIADLEIKLEEPELQPTEEPMESFKDVLIPEQEVKSSEVVEKENTSVEVGEFANTVTEFNSLPKVKNAKSSTYYIQIATVSKKENVAKMIDLHGKKYPVYVIKNPAKSSYQILVGPLNDDEYALVLARFKQTYKDAFLRVVK